MRLKKCLGRGSTYSMFTTGHELSEGLYAGIKLQRRGRSSPFSRFVEEMGTMATIARDDERILEALPRVFALIRVEDSPLQALFVEDASQDGKYEVTGADMSRELRELVEGNVGATNLVGEYRDYMAFRVGETERILDAEPSPFVRASAETLSLRESVRQSVGDFTVTLPTHSPLAISIQSPPWL